MNLTKKRTRLINLFHRIELISIDGSKFFDPKELENLSAEDLETVMTEGDSPFFYDSKKSKNRISVILKGHKS